jgi:CRP-like cAMP-binding protein
VGTLKDLDFFGESALLGAQEDGGQPKRNATVAVESDYVQVLMLSRAAFELLLEEEVLSTDVVTKVEQENRRRSEINLKNQHASSFAVPLQQPRPPPNPPTHGVML